jgi:hypothetical protein
MFTFATDELSHYAQAESLTYYGSYTLNVAMAVSAPILFSIVALIGLSFVRNGHPVESTRSPSRASLITNRDVTRTQGRSLWLSRLNKWKLALQLLLLPKEWISSLELGYAFLKTVCELLTGLLVILLVICVSVKVNLSDSVADPITHSHTLSLCNGQNSPNSTSTTTFVRDSDSLLRWTNLYSELSSAPLPCSN